MARNEMHCGLCGPDVECPGHPFAKLLAEAALGAAGVEGRETVMFETVEAMLRYGGSFVKALGAAARAADAQNRARLVSAFPDFFGKYAEIAENERRALRIRRERQAKETP